MPLPGVPRSALMPARARSSGRLGFIRRGATHAAARGALLGAHAGTAY